MTIEYRVHRAVHNELDIDEGIGAIRRRRVRRERLRHKFKRPAKGEQRVSAGAIPQEEESERKAPEASYHTRSIHPSPGLVLLVLTTLQIDFEANVGSGARAFDRNPIDQRAHDREAVAAIGVAFAAPAAGVADLEDQLALDEPGAQAHASRAIAVSVLDGVSGGFADRQDQIFDASRFELQRLEECAQRPAHLR